jgi:hypothetical protein
MKSLWGRRKKKGYDESVNTYVRNYAMLLSQLEAERLQCIVHTILAQILREGRRIVQICSEMTNARDHHHR